MADPAPVSDGQLLAGVATGAAAVGAAAKPLFDWLTGRRKDRVSSEDLIRDDLMTQLREQRAEIVQLRGELMDARKELREFATVHQDAIMEWHGRYSALLLEMAELRRIVHGAEVSQKTPPIA